MITLRDAKITDALPQIIAKEPWAQAMAYAINRQMLQLLTYADGVLVSASIDNMPDRILDILAVELRLPHYDQSYPTRTKRELVKTGLTYWAHAGTVASLADILVNIFGDAEIEEWFDYNSEPGYFRILTGNPKVTGDTLEQFKRTAQNVKRLSAWLEEVLVDLALPNTAIYNGFALHDHTEIMLKQEG